MSAPLTPCSAAPRLYLPPDRERDGRLTGFLLAEGAEPPDQIALKDAFALDGWFVLTGPVADVDIPEFAEAAGIWFSELDEAGALLTWFTESQPGALDGWTVLATPPGERSSVAAQMSIRWGNLAFSIPELTAISASEDGTKLQFTATDLTIQLMVTPYGSRDPVQFDLVGSLDLNLAGTPGSVGIASFQFDCDGDGFDSLDFGMRNYTSQTDKKESAKSARYRPFAFGEASRSITAILDPLAPTDKARSHLSLPAATTLDSHYMSASGDRLAATLGDDFRILFAERLIEVGKDGKPAPRPSPIYTLIPSGTATLANPSPPPAPEETGGNGPPNLSTSLMAGLSAVEYFTPPATGATLTFVPGQAAYAPKVAADTTPVSASTAAESDDEPSRFGELTDIGTTSWVTISSPEEGSGYFSQPDNSIMHQGDDAGSSFLSYLPLRVAALAEGESEVFPMMPYAAVATGSGMDAAELAGFERMVWSPRRVAVMQGEAQRNAAMTMAAIAQEIPDPPYGTTPQGLLLKFGEDGSWDELTLALDCSPQTKTLRQPGLILRDIGADLREAMQVNNLFLVISDGKSLLDNATCAYFLSELAVDELKRQISDPAVQQWISDLAGEQGVQYPTLAAFDSAVIHGEGAPENMAQFAPLLHRTCADFSLFAAGDGNDPGWEFDLSPYDWQGRQTILIFKYCQGSLAAAAADTTRWSKAEVFVGQTDVVTQRIARIIAQARADAESDPDMRVFVEKVVDDPSWTGIVALNAKVPLSGLPKQMRALATGIDPASFRAHHVGINATSVTIGADRFTANPSSIFGLIDYEAPESSTPNTDAAGESRNAVDYDFTVRSLKVRIANSLVANFASRVDLLIGRLFGDATSQISAPTNNLSFSGFYQQAQASIGDQIGTYQFVTTAPAAFRLTSKVVEQIAITSASFVTQPINEADSTRIDSVFQLSGAISFYRQEAFDAFSFGPEEPANIIEKGLSYRGLAIRMSFDEAAPNYRDMVFDPSGIVLDNSTSTVRSDSLVNHFPMKLKGLVAGIDDITPDSLGYMPVDSPLEGAKMTAPWYGLQFDLDLGSAGSLAAEAGFSAGLLLAWEPEKADATMYVGLALPGVSSGQRSISLQGVLSLDFGGVQFLVSPPTYLLQLRNISLGFLSLSFPTGGQVNMTLFGNPDAESTGALGWLGSYLKNGAGKPKKPPPAQLFGGSS